MHSQKIASIVIMLFSAIFFAATFDIEEKSFVSGLTARFWPQMSLIILFGLAALLYAQAGKEKGGEPRVPWRQAAVCCVFFLAYVLGLDTVGYLFATLVFQIVFLWYMGIRGIRDCLVLPCVITLVLMAAFVGGMGVMLPLGTGPFRVINSSLWG